jgi:hypothetical protein
LKHGENELLQMKAKRNSTLPIRHDERLTPHWLAADSALFMRCHLLSEDVTPTAARLTYRMKRRIE